MKLVRYGRPGKEKPGLIDAAGKLRDLSEVVDDIDGATLAPRVLARLAKIKPESLPAARGAPRIGPCVANVGNFIAVGLNYADHAAEIGHGDPQRADPVQQGAVLHRRPLRRRGDPQGFGKDRLGGRARRRHRRARELRQREGRARPCRRLLRRATTSPSATISIERGGGQWTKGKGCPTFGPLGPWLVTADEIADPQKLVDVARRQRRADAERLDRDDDLRRRARSSAYISHFMILEPGDVITTGTPPGVGTGKKPPRFLKAGDTVSLGVGGLGQQAQRVVAWSKSV